MWTLCYTIQDGEACGHFVIQDGEACGHLIIPVRMVSHVDTLLYHPGW